MGPTRSKIVVKYWLLRWDLIDSGCENKNTDMICCNQQGSIMVMAL
jgi:hypothetical protein